MANSPLIKNTNKFGAFHIFTYLCNQNLKQLKLIKLSI